MKEIKAGKRNLLGIISVGLAAIAGIQFGLYPYLDKKEQEINRTGTELNHRIYQKPDIIHKEVEGEDNIVYREPLTQLVQLTTNPKRPFELRPSLDIEIGGVTYRINEFGYRGVPRPPKKGPGVHRIGFFGGSPVFGVGLAEDKTVPFLLEQILNQRGDGITYEVLDLGMPRTNLIVDVEQFRYFVNEKGFQLDEAYFWEDEFAFNMPGWNGQYYMPKGTDQDNETSIDLKKWVESIKTSKKTLRLEETEFNELQFYFNINSLPDGSLTNSQEIRPYISFFLLGYSSSLNSLRKLSKSSGNTGLCFILDDLYARIKPDLTVERSYKHNLFAINQFCHEQEIPVIDTSPISDSVIKQLRLGRACQLMNSPIDKVPIDEKREEILKVLANRSYNQNGIR